MRSQDPRDAKDSNVKRSGCDRESSVPYVHLSILPTPSAEGLRREEYGEVSSERRKRRTEPEWVEKCGPKEMQRLDWSLSRKVTQDIKTQPQINHYQSITN